MCDGPAARGEDRGWGSARAVPLWPPRPSPIAKFRSRTFQRKDCSDLNYLLDRAIIGPTKYPIGIYDALAALLTEAGVQNATNKVIVSDIPLRQ